ncbi:trihelix transcription factor ENAP1-like isoform X1 [Malania oleifera]|uniref:trihelix transcription factor ENAP1-like isoform X1 n=1 Tax=Malania oleifera TaxID=397392 RepID=UPI0025ADC87B|nr:trihelix transcription factor ENAP1-like isoform X1 [Malania oleifera]
MPTMDDGTDTPPPAAALPSRQSHPLPFREDCWSEDATHTLIEAWGDRHLELNRGNLRQKHWQEVADAVNARHGHVKKARRTDVQCKNRIDTLKKKYKIEKARVLESGGTLTSQWPFYATLDALIGSSVPAKKPLPPVNRKTSPLPVLPPMALIPVGPRSKRPATATATAAVDDSFFRQSFSAVAAAAAAMEAAEAGGSGSESSRSSLGSRQRGREGEREGYRELARAIERFGQIYERVEGAKQMQMIELEKQRMQFAKDLEFQRMQLFVDTQVQLEKIKRAKGSARGGL